MKPVSDDADRIIQLLTDAPGRIRRMTRGVQPAQLTLRSDAEPWSIHDILAHLRACSDVWGMSILAMIAQDHPIQRYVSPRAAMRKAAYADPEFGVALARFAGERRELVAALSELDTAGWTRRGTFTGTSPRERDQTVLSYSERLVNHEQAHLDQIETLATGLIPDPDMRIG